LSSLMTMASSRPSPVAAAKKHTTGAEIGLMGPVLVRVEAVAGIQADDDLVGR
jgi:hypothetical protein